MSHFEGHRRISFRYMLSMSTATAKSQGASLAEIRQPVAETLRECLPAGDCSHLADGEAPGNGLSDEPCELCGLYFCDEGQAS